MFKSFFYFAFISLLIFSCTTHQKISFNKDWSGKVTTTVDFTKMLEQFGQEIGEAGIPVFEDSLNAIKIENLKKIKGIENVKIESSTNKISVLSYEFKDVSALNATGFLFTQDMTKDPLESMFTLKSQNEIEINLPVLKSEGQDEMGLGSQFMYELEVDFQKKIKSFKSNSDCDSIYQKDNSLFIHTNLEKLMDAKKKHKLTVKVK